MEQITSDLQLPDFPEALRYLWNIYHRIRKRWGAGFNGPLPIPWGEIESFCNVTHTRFAPWEIDLIETIDDLYQMPHIERNTPKTLPGKDIVRTVDITDGAGVRGLLRSVGRRRKPAKKGG